MDHVTVRTMDLDHLETRFSGAPRRLDKGGNHFLNAVDGERLGRGKVLAKRQRTGGNGLPAALTLGNSSTSQPWRGGARLTSRVPQLYSGHASLLLQKTNDT